MSNKKTKGSPNKWYFTFGQNHLHPLGGYSMKDFWIEVYGSHEEAREKVTRRFGDKWSMQYPEDAFDKKFFPKGCHEIIK
jgi:hypothetical protein